MSTHNICCEAIMFLWEVIIMSTHNVCCEAILMSTYNICFYGEIENYNQIPT